MSRRYWCLILAAIGCLSASASEAQDNSKATERTQSAAADQQPATPPPPPPDLATDQAKTYQPACEAPKNREDATFCVERRAMRAAEQAVAISDRGFWVTFWGTLAVVVSVIFTAWAAVAASRAAEAAESSVEDSRKDAAEQVARFNDQLKLQRASSKAATTMANTASDSSKRQLRAYINVKALHCVVNEGVPAIQIAIINGGQTAAVDVLIWVRVEIGTWRGDIARAPIAKPLHHAIFIQPRDHQDVWIPLDHKPTAAEIEVIAKANPERLIIHGRVEYNDVFGKPHVTPFGVGVAGHPDQMRDLFTSAEPVSVNLRFETIESREEMT